MATGRESTEAHSNTAFKLTGAEENGWRPHLSAMRVRPMRYSDIKRYLKPYVMHDRRRTTVNHAFAAAVAPFDAFNDAEAREAVVDLGQNPDEDLQCVYCGEEAQTWDHVFATVADGQFSGAGHRLGNLLPCCKPCNSKKGNKNWEVYVRSLKVPQQERESRIETIARYLKKHFTRDPLPKDLPEYNQLIAIRDDIIEKMKDGAGSNNRLDPTGAGKRRVL